MRYRAEVLGSVRLARRVPLRTAGGRLLLAMCLVLGVAMSACASAGQSEEPREPVPPTRLRVENQAFLDMNIYVYRSTQRIRIGTASGNGTSTLTIPASVLSGVATTLRFQADPIGGSRASVSTEITVSPGDTVLMTIPPR